MNDFSNLNDYEISYTDLLVIFEAAQHSLTNIDLKDNIADFLDLSDEEVNQVLYKVRSFLSDEYA